MRKLDFDVVNIKHFSAEHQQLEIDYEIYTVLVIYHLEFVYLHYFYDQDQDSLFS